jgi:hypothetical protein
MRTSKPRLEQVARAPLFWLAVLYVLVGILYALITPVFEKPDGDGHYGYIMYLREHHVLPPLAISAQWSSEFKQPPLYHAIAAVLTGWLPDDSNPERMIVPNPYVGSSVSVYRNDNRNRFLHPPDMTPLILASRLVSLLFGLGTMIASYFLAAQWFSKKSLVPIATAAVVGFQSKFLYIATAVSNDAAIAFFGAMVALVLMYRLQRGDFAYFAALMGGLLGLASIAKVSGLVFFPLVGLALLLIHRGFRPAFFRDGILIVTVSLLIGGWWYARNALLYDDPFAFGAHTTAFVQTRAIWERLKYELTGAEYTFWANQSRTFISPIGLDQALVWWGRISLGLLVLSLLLKYQSMRANLPALVALLCWPVTFLFLLVMYWSEKFSWFYGRLLFPAIAPTALLLISGWQYIFPPPWRRLTLTLSAGMVMIVSILVPFVTLYPLFHPSREWQAAQVEHPVKTIYVDPETGSPVVQLIGYNLPKPYAMAGTYFPVELCWEPLEQTQAPYTMFVQLLDLSQLSVHDSPTAWGRRETYPGLGNRPTDRWALHQVFCDTVFVQVFPETPTPLGAAIEVGFTDPERKNRLQAVDAGGDPITLSVVGRVPVLSSGNMPAAVRSSQYALDGAIGLERAQFSDAMGSSFMLTLTWQSLRSVPYDATVFVHLRGADGNILAQVDRQPLDGRFPTSYWLPGQTITDVIHLPLTPGAYQGPLVLNVGMYTWPSLQRLPVVDAAGAPQRDNAIVINVPRSQ